MNTVKLQVFRYIKNKIHPSCTLLSSAFAFLQVIRYLEQANLSAQLNNQNMLPVEKALTLLT